MPDVPASPSPTPTDSTENNTTGFESWNGQPGTSVGGPNPAPPPAAAVVIAQGAQDDADLAAQLEKERAARVDREKRVMELEDENHRLRRAQGAPAPTPAPTAGPGWTFFEGAD